MSNRKQVYNSLHEKMEEAGFILEKEQGTHHQNIKELELKFIHPFFLEKLKISGYIGRAEKFYLKPLSDEPSCEIGFVVGKTMAMIKNPIFVRPNSVDSYRGEPAWVNRIGDNSFDELIIRIKKYIIEC